MVTILSIHWSAVSHAVNQIFKIKCMVVKIYGGIISHNIATCHIMNKINVRHIAKAELPRHRENREF